MNKMDHINKKNDEKNETDFGIWSEWNGSE